MAISLGQSPWLLIGLTFLELLFIIIPAFIAAKIEHTTLKIQLNEMGFRKSKGGDFQIIIKIVIGLASGLLLYLVGGYIYLFFQSIAEAILGANFFETGESSAISTHPQQPNIIQLAILLVLQFVIVAVSEEAFFRGFLINIFQNKFRNSLSIILSSILFTLYHVPPFLVPFSTIISLFGFYFTFGLLLSLLFILFKKSLVPVILCHGLYNFLVLLL